MKFIYSQKFHVSIHILPTLAHAVANKLCKCVLSSPHSGLELWPVMHDEPITFIILIKDKRSKSSYHNNTQYQKQQKTEALAQLYQAMPCWRWRWWQLRPPQTTTDDNANWLYNNLMNIVAIAEILITINPTDWSYS